jgi:hypothetical protein
MASCEEGVVATSQGFRVDMDALDEAAAGVNGTIEIFNRQQVSSIPFEPSWLGDQTLPGVHELSGAGSDLFSGWQRGVQSLVSDAGSLATGLADSATRYRKADKNAASSASAIFQGTGPDPGLL